MNYVCSQPLCTDSCLKEDWSIPTFLLGLLCFLMTVAYLKTAPRGWCLPGYQLHLLSLLACGLSITPRTPGAKVYVTLSLPLPNTFSTGELFSKRTVEAAHIYTQC